MENWTQIQSPGSRRERKGAGKNSRVFNPDLTVSPAKKAPDETTMN